MVETRRIKIVAIFLQILGIFLFMIEKPIETRPIRF